VVTLIVKITVIFVLACVSGNSLNSLREVPDVENYHENL